MPKRTSKIDLSKLSGSARKDIGSMLKELEGRATPGVAAPTWPTRFVAIPGSKQAQKRS
jgi:hypothetical protein